MPKLVTVLRPEKIEEQARYYVRSHILLPAGTIGLFCMVGGVGSLGYQLLVNHTYSWLTFLTSSVLIVVGALCGWAQARYHRYLFATFPEVYAARMRTAVAQRNRKKAKAEPRRAVDRAPWAWVCHCDLHCRSGPDLRRISCRHCTRRPRPTSRLCWCPGRDSTGPSCLVGVECVG